MTTDDGPRRSTLPPLIAAVVMTALIFGLLGYWVGRPAEPEGSAIDRIAADLADEQEAERAEGVAELTVAAQEVQEQLLPLLAEMDEVMPVDGSEGEPADADQVADWRATTADAAEHLDELGMGTTGVDLAVGAFRSTVLQLDTAAATYGLAIDDGGEVEQELAELAATQRDNAVRSWTPGAEQLDLLNIDAGRGHVHLYLPDTGETDALPEEFREPHDD